MLTKLYLRSVTEGTQHYAWSLESETGRGIIHLLMRETLSSQPQS